MSTTLNADMGEALGIHTFGNDTALLHLVDTISVACGMHSGDPTTMSRMVTAALNANVTIGAHPRLPDLVGFGRREMILTADEVRDLIRYQVGALQDSSTPSEPHCTTSNRTARSTGCFRAARS
jgi:5-oxoprolinase (ATP-hydrolysing) subunit A